MLHLKRVKLFFKERFMHRSNFFYSIFFPIVLIGTVFIAGFSLYTYQKTYNTLQENLIVDRKSNINQIKGNIEQKIQTIEYSFTTYSNTTSFKNLISRPLTFQDYASVREISSELAYIGAIGIGNASYRLVSLTHGWEINNGSLNQLTEEAVAQISDSMSESDQYIVWKPDNNGIKMYIQLPTFSTERSAVGIASISRQAFTSLFDASQDEFLAIYNQKGQLLFSNHTEQANELSAKMLTLDQKVGSFEQSDKETYIYSQSDYNQWVYVTALPKATIRQSILGLGSGLAFITIVLWLFFMIVTYLVANTAAQPLRKIRDLLAIDSPSKSRKAEINQILTGIDTIVESNLDLSAKIQHQIPELETLFLLNLFRNRMSYETLNEKLKQLNYHFKGDERFIVVLIQIDDLGGRDHTTEDLFLVSIENIVSEIIPPTSRFQPIVLNQDTQATLLCLPATEDKQKVIDYCQAVRQAASDYLKIKISFGISLEYGDLTDSKQALDTAKEALHFRIHLGQEATIFYHEIAPQLDQKTVMKYPREAEQLFLDAMRSTNQVETKKAYQHLMTLIWQQNTNPITIENALFQLINSITQLGQLLGADYEMLLNNRKVYLDVLNKDNPSEIQQIIYQTLIEPIVNSIQKTTDRQMRNLSDQMLALVHQQYDHDISLESIADQLHYSSNYLSNVFKKEMGWNFTDYLQNYRLTIAKKWLMETDMTVKAISERLQYTNPQNFIRFFKKKENMTPGEYRKQHSNRHQR
ncbi:helix-turn-helix domain-containing protein [Enterococcus aquimarinus]|nr:helix-turn-helix domain-containing protein [Enterococcus aquimarinus]